VVEASPVTDSSHGSKPAGSWTTVLGRYSKPSLVFFVVSLAAGLLVGRYVSPTWTVEKIALDASRSDDGKLTYVYDKVPKEIVDPLPMEEAGLNAKRIADLNAGRASAEAIEEIEALLQAGDGEYAYKTAKVDGKATRLYFQLVPKRHWRLWSLLPAIVAVGLCWMTREPLVSLLGGIVVGAFLLGLYDITGDVLIANLATPGAAGVLLLYLWLLGGLLGVWNRTGAAQAFADLMTRRFVRGPRTARLVAWCLGVIFFQGGTVSTVLVGTTVKPLADRERVSHEELSYIVDSTASPIASQLALNAWPGYIQAFIFVAGVPWLATERDRIVFFFTSVPFCFYAIFAVLFTLLLTIDKSPFLGWRMRAAIKRARETGQLDHPDADPLSDRGLNVCKIPDGYTPHVLEFFLPLGLLIFVAIGTFLNWGMPLRIQAPQIQWAFGAALLLAGGMALFRGMRLKDLMDGLGDGFKGVVLGSVILLLAVTIGNISKEAGGGIYLVELLGERVP
jgi:Na+/H+ antiporter NhaC